MPVLFEIHITTTELNESIVQEFVDFCATIDAKPILIELPVGQQRQQPMISKVVKLEDPQEIHPVLVELKAAFIVAGFPVKRVKVEVPLEYEAMGKAAFPDFRGGYYEWHGRVKTVDPGALADICASNGLHLSRNSLKGKKGTKLVTLRQFNTPEQFRGGIRSVKKMLERNGFAVEKDEAEYCVFDSNKGIDRGWSDVPEFTDYGYATQLAIDGFMRRVAVVGGPFMAKGSVVMRQYLPDPRQRTAEDIDFVYLGEADEATAAGIFTDWLTRVTETEMNDEVVFRSFTENTFWRGIDYAMNDDFPTTNTDLLVTVQRRESEEIGLDISWNLPIPETAVSLLYRPLTGKPFELQHTVPLSLQISWKLHQSVVRPRYKDLNDLVILLSHPLVDQEVLKKAAAAYAEECRKDGILPSRLGIFAGEQSAPFTLLASEAPFYSVHSYVPDAIDAERYQLPKDFKLYRSADIHADQIAEIIGRFGEALRTTNFSQLLDLSPSISQLEARQRVERQGRFAKDRPVKNHGQEVKPEKIKEPTVRSWWQRLFD